MSALKGRGKHVVVVQHGTPVGVREGGERMLSFIPVWGKAWEQRGLGRGAEM